MTTHTVGAWTAQAGALVLATLAACSSSTPAPADGNDAATCDPCGGDDSGTGAGSGTDVNPDGVAYPAPASGYGHNPRSGNTPGSIIQNFKFLGYLNGDMSQPLTTISLADYYDPCNKRYKLLHISVAAVWCEPCNEETDAVVADLGSSSSVLNADQVVFIQALDDGPTEGVPATKSDLDYWITKHSSNFTEMLDPGLKNLGGFFNAAAIPWNSDIDVRTMEMLDSSEGWDGDVGSEVKPGLSALPAMPSYPLPAGVTCN
ncbi:MAG TPA: hypothetical protein VGL81_03175 [Polyangiaceae bacterium]|jgi:hypothetical protein